MANATNTTAAFVIMNGEKIDVDVTNVSLDSIINEMVEVTKREHGAHIRIAAKLNDLLPFAWYDVAPQEKSDNATAFAPHWKAVYDGFKKAGHSNPSVPGKRIRDYGRNLRAGLAPNGKTMADGTALAEGEGADGEGANPAKRSPMLRNVEELTALWKFNDRLAGEAPAKVQAAQKHIVAALAALGLDVKTIK
jgi:hypothetical protein